MDRMAAALMNIHKDYAAALAKVDTSMRFVSKYQAATMRVVSPTLRP